MKSSQVASVVAMVLSRLTADERRRLVMILTDNDQLDMHEQVKRFVLAHTANYAFVRGAIRNPFDEIFNTLINKGTL